MPATAMTTSTMIQTVELLFDVLFLSLDAAEAVAVFALLAEVAEPAALVWGRVVAAVPAFVGELVEPAALVWSPDEGVDPDAAAVL
jgi:hypothetical protein